MTRLVFAILVVLAFAGVAGAQVKVMELNETPLADAVRTWENTYGAKAVWVAPQPGPDGPKRTAVHYAGDDKDVVLGSILEPEYTFNIDGQQRKILAFQRSARSGNVRSATAPAESPSAQNAVPRTQQPPQQSPISAVPVTVVQQHPGQGVPAGVYVPPPIIPGWDYRTNSHPYVSKCGATWGPDINPALYAPIWYIYRSPYYYPMVPARDCPADIVYAFGAHAGFGSVPIIQTSGSIYGSAGVVGSVGIGNPIGGAYGGWYGIPFLFDFQVDELRMQYQDRRTHAKLKVRGEDCNSECLKKMHIVVVRQIAGHGDDDETNDRFEERYITGAAYANNWHEKEFLIPLDADGSARFWIIREDADAGTMIGFERHMWLPSIAMRRGHTKLPISPEMFATARKLKVMQQHIAVEVKPGVFEYANKGVTPTIP
jgi:hypothetical protein